MKQKLQSINRKVIFGGVTQLLLSTLFGILIISQSSKIESWFYQLTAKDYAANERILEMGQNIYRFRMPLLVMLSREDRPERVEKRQEAINILSILDEDLAYIQQKASSPKEKQLYDRFYHTYQNWVSTNKDILNLGVEGRIDEAIALQRSKGGEDFLQMDAAMIALQDEFNRQKEVGLNNVESGLSTVARFTIGSVVLLILSSFLVFAVLRRSLMRMMSRLIETLSQSSDETVYSAKTISEASQTISVGAVQQASAIQESVTALDQLNASAQDTSSKAEEASSKTQFNRKIVEEAQQLMHALANSMEEIIKSSEESRKVVASIDEIAFQTNLLALNAAVEAARAGEAGSGFAVVAEEVRTLANRSADAAKNTSEMIGNSLHSIHKGQEIVNQSIQVFDQINEMSKELQEFIAYVQTNVHDQASGMTQVVASFREIDIVVQQNSDVTKQSQEISENLKGQVQTVRDVIERMRYVAGLKYVEKEVMTA